MRFIVHCGSGVVFYPPGFWEGFVWVLRGAVFFLHMSEFSLPVRRGTI